MVEAWMIMDAGAEILSMLMLTVAAKTLFEKSILLDRTMFILLGFSGLSDLIFCCMIDENAFPGMKILSNLPLILGICIFLRGEKKQVLRRLRSLADAFVIFFIPSGLACSAVTVLLFPQKLDENGKVVIESIMGVIVGLQVLIMVYLFFELLRKKISLQLRWGARLLLVGYAIMITAIDIYLENASSVAFAELPATVKGFLAISIVIIYLAAPLLVVKTKLSTIYETERQMQQELIASELKHFEQYRENQEETRQFRHDIINNLRVVQMLQDQGKTAEAKAYVDGLLGTVSALSPKVVTGCELLDCILSSKLEQMDKENICYSIDGVLDRGLSMTPIDICTIFANALDNVIEACVGAEGEKLFRMTMKRTSAFYCITMENTMKANDNLKKSMEQNHFTTKSNNIYHGFGLKGIRETTEKNGGQMMVEVQKNMFLLTILLPVPN